MPILITVSLNYLLLIVDDHIFISYRTFISIIMLNVYFYLKSSTHLSLHNAIIRDFHIGITGAQLFHIVEQYHSLLLIIGYYNLVINHAVYSYKKNETFKFARFLLLSRLVSSAIFFKLV